MAERSPGFRPRQKQIAVSFFHTSLLVDFDIALMTDIMNTPVIKLEDKGYNCFSQRMTTVRDELGRKVSVTEMIEVIQKLLRRRIQHPLQRRQPG